MSLFRSGAQRTAALICVATLAGGCVSVPRFRAEPADPAVLAAQATSLDRPPFPSALSLPTIPAGERGTGARESRPTYRVGPLDELVVLVWGREDLGSQVPVGQDGALRSSRVREDGTIGMPFLDRLSVAGMTTGQIESMVRSRYAALIENPQVEVELRNCESKSVEVNGAVARPGTYYLCSDMLTVGDVLAVSNGTAPDADLERGILTRNGTSFHLDYDEAVRGASLAHDVLLQDGDRVYFPRLDERVVYVFGEVLRQGAYPIPEEGMSILDALGMARGIDTDSGKHQGIYLMRPADSGIAAYRLTLSQILQGPEVQLVDGDRLFVAMSGLERWDRWWRKALPFTTFRTNLQVWPE